MDTPILIIIINIASEILDMQALYHDEKISRNKKILIRKAEEIVETIDESYGIISERIANQQLRFKINAENKEKTEFDKLVDTLNRHIGHLQNPHKEISIKEITISKLDSIWKILEQMIHHFKFDFIKDKPDEILNKDISQLIILMLLHWGFVHYSMIECMGRYNKNDVGNGCQELKLIETRINSKDLKVFNDDHKSKTIVYVKTVYHHKKELYIKFENYLTSTLNWTPNKEYYSLMINVKKHPNKIYNKEKKSTYKDYKLDTEREIGGKKVKVTSLSNSFMKAATDQNLKGKRQKHIKDFLDANSKIEKEK